jgi:hypothetical protein
MLAVGIALILGFVVVVARILVTAYHTGLVVHIACAAGGSTGVATTAVGRAAIQLGIHILQLPFQVAIGFGFAVLQLSFLLLFALFVGAGFAVFGRGINIVLCLHGCKAGC